MNAAEQIYRRELSGARCNPAAAQRYCDLRNQGVKPEVTGIQRYFVKDGRPHVEMMPIEFIKAMG